MKPEYFYERLSHRIVSKSLRRDTPKARGSKPSLHLRLSYEGGGQEKQFPSVHLFCCSLWPALGMGEAGNCQSAAAPRGWAGETNSAPHNSLWAYICCCSSKASRACLPAGSWCTTIPLGNLDGTDHDHPHQLRRGWANLGWGKFYPLSPGQQFLVPLKTQCHLSTVKIDAGNQPRIPPLSNFFFFRENLHFSGCL